MKTLLTALLLTISTLAISSDYCDGWEDGYCELCLKNGINLDIK